MTVQALPSRSLTDDGLVAVEPEVPTVVDDSISNDDDVSGDDDTHSGGRIMMKMGGPV